MVLTVSDSAAALIGKRYGSIKIAVEGNLKSLEGSVAFGLFTFLCVLLVLLFMTEMAKLQLVLIALVIAVVVTGFELISLHGTDNLFIPLGTYYIIDRMSQYNLDVHLATVVQLVASLLIVFILFLKNSHTSFGWKVTLALLLFAAWSLCGHWWVFPTLIFMGIIWSILYFFMHKPNIKLDVKAALSIGIMPVLPIFASAMLDDLKLFFPAYLCILWLEIIFMMSELYLVRRAAPLKLLKTNKKATQCIYAPDKKTKRTKASKIPFSKAAENLTFLDLGFLQTMLPFALPGLLMFLLPAIIFYHEWQIVLFLLISSAGLPLALPAYFFLKTGLQKHHRGIGGWLYLKSRVIALLAGSCAATTLAWFIKFY